MLVLVSNGQVILTACGLTVGAYNVDVLVKKGTERLCAPAPLDRDMSKLPDPGFLSSTLNGIYVPANALSDLPKSVPDSLATVKTFSVLSYHVKE